MRRSRFLAAAAVAAAPALVVTSALVVVVVLVVTSAVVVAVASPASAAGSGSRFSETTTVGTHNTYDPATFQYLAQALDQHPGLIELDVWDDIFTREWKVSHDNPLGNGNNCVAAGSPSQL